MVRAASKLISLIDSFGIPEPIDPTAFQAGGPSEADHLKPDT